MGVGAGLYMCDVVKKSSRSLTHLLMSSCYFILWLAHWSHNGPILTIYTAYDVFPRKEVPFCEGSDETVVHLWGHIPKKQFQA